MPKLKGFHVVFCNSFTVIKILQRKTKFTRILLKMVDIRRKLSPFLASMLLIIYNVLHIFFQFGTFMHIIQMPRIGPL